MLVGLAGIVLTYVWGSTRHRSQWVGGLEHHLLWWSAGVSILAAEVRFAGVCVCGDF